MRWVIAAVMLTACSIESSEIQLNDNVSTEMTKSLGCFDIDTGVGYENSFYRAFVLADQGVRAGFHLETVSFGYIAPGSAGVAVPVDINVYAYDGPIGGSTLDLLARTPISMTTSTMIQAGVTTTTLLEVPTPTDILGTDVVLIEVHVGRGEAWMGHLSIAANEQGEQQPSYTRCNTGEVQLSSDAADDHRPYDFVLFGKGTAIPDVSDRPPSL